MSTRFISPPDRDLYHAQVWDIVRQITQGSVATYGQIAALIPTPANMEPKDYQSWGARWVGGAMSACPQDVPWQRVINSQGKISLRPGGGGEIQRQLLEDEGIQFDDRERVDLKRYGWQGPTDEWLEEHGLKARSGLGGGK